MKKDKKKLSDTKNKPTANVKSESFEGLSKLGKNIVFCGIGTVILGFFVLTATNPAGDNWASIISPFLLIGGYITIAIGIIK